MIKVYLAGPAVFRKDAKAYGDYLKQLCGELSLAPLWPLDNESAGGEPSEIARTIRKWNCEMIERADAVVADISPFRGPNMDPGTAFEIGYGAALNKSILLYSTSTASLRDRTLNHCTAHPHAGRLFDDEDMEVEDFGLTENLMIATCSATIHPTMQDALAAAARINGTRAAPTN